MCEACAKSGRKCGGYTAVHPKGGPRLSALASALSIASYEIPFKIPGSQNDRRIFHYFCVHAVVELAGGHRSPFWNRIVLQCSQEEPVVRSASLALSYEHLDYVTRDPDDRRKNSGMGSASIEGLQQHHKAVRQLRKYIGTNRRPSVKVVLVCCLLFYYFECSRGDYQTAILHLHNGMAILSSEHLALASFLNPDLPTADPDLAELVIVFGVVDVMVSQLDLSRMPELDLTTEAERLGAPSCLESIVSGIKAVADTTGVYVKLMNWATRFMVGSQLHKLGNTQSLSPALLREKQELEQQLTDFASAIQSYCDSQRSMTQHEEYERLSLCVAEIKLSCYSGLMAVECCFPNTHMPFRSPNPTTSQMIECLTTLVAAIANNPLPSVTSMRNSRQTSVAEGESDVSEPSTSTKHLQVPRTRTGSLSRRSASPSPFPDSLPRYRTFSAHGCVLSSCMVISSKTTSPQMREKVVALAALCSERREGPWCGAIVNEVIRSLQELEERFWRLRQSGVDASAEDEDSEDSEVGAGSSDVDSDVGSGADSVAADSTQRVTREYAERLLEGRPFCAVAACMARGNHGERCAWCSGTAATTTAGPSGGMTVVGPSRDTQAERLGQQDYEPLSWEDIGARMVGGVSGFERLMQSRPQARR